MDRLKDWLEATTALTVAIIVGLVVGYPLAQISSYFVIKLVAWTMFYLGLDI